MSNSERFRDTGMTSSFYQGVDAENKRIIKLLLDYFELTLLPGDDGVTHNPEWDSGFHAAIAVIRSNRL